MPSKSYTGRPLGRPLPIPSRESFCREFAGRICAQDFSTHAPNPNRHRPHTRVELSCLHNARKE